MLISAQKNRNFFFKIQKEIIFNRLELNELLHFHEFIFFFARTLVRGTWQAEIEIP